MSQKPDRSIFGYLFFILPVVRLHVRQAGRQLLYLGRRLIILSSKGSMRLYIQIKANPLENKLFCPYRHAGANSDGADWFLICINLTSQQQSEFQASATQFSRLCLSHIISIDHYPLHNSPKISQNCIIGAGPYPRPSSHVSMIGLWGFKIGIWKEASVLASPTPSICL